MDLKVKYVHSGRLNLAACSSIMIMAGVCGDMCMCLQHGYYFY